MYCALCGVQCVLCVVWFRRVARECRSVSVYDVGSKGVRTSSKRGAATTESCAVSLLCCDPPESPYL